MIYIFTYIGLFITLFSTAHIEAFCRSLWKVPTIKSFHERYQNEKISPQQRIMQLKKEGSSVQQFVRNWYRAEEDTFLGNIAPHICPTIPDRIRMLSSQCEGNENPEIEACQKTPQWAADEVKKLLPRARIPAKKLIITLAETTNALHLDDDTYKLGIEKYILEAGERSRDFFHGIMLHELAHMRLQHGKTKKLIRKFIGEKSHFDRDFLVMQLSHLQEFCADTYLTTDSWKTTTELCAYMAFTGALGDAFISPHRSSEDSHTHPSPNRRFQNLKTISELLAVEAGTLD